MQNVSSSVCHSDTYTTILVYVFVLMLSEVSFASNSMLYLLGDDDCN